MNKRLLTFTTLLLTTLTLSACDGAGNNNSDNPGILTITVNNDNLNLANTTTATISLVDSNGVTYDQLVTIASQNTQVLTLNTSICALSTAHNSCTVTLTAAGLGTTTLSAAATNYTTTTSSSITVNQYATFPSIPGGTNNSITGARGVTNSSNVYLTGSYLPNGESKDQAYLYAGPLSGNSGNWYPITVSPSLYSGTTLVSSSLYGPDNSSTAGNVHFVGTYKTVSGGNYSYGFYYDGPINGSGSSGDWTNMDVSTLLNGGDALEGVIPHSTMNGIVVGNFDTTNAGVLSGRVFIYNSANTKYYELQPPVVGTTSLTAYGIWYNGGNSYTIAGGYRDPITSGDVASLVDWDSSTQIATHWQTYTYQNNSALISHFEGITTDGSTGYNLAGMSTTSDLISDFSHVSRNNDKSFNTTASWIDIKYPNSATTTANTVFENYILGVYTLSGSSNIYPYSAEVANPV